MDVNEHDKLSHIRLRHKWKERNSTFIAVPADNALIALHSSFVGQLADKSLFRSQKAINNYKSKSLFDIVNLLLWGEKVIQKNVGFHNLKEIPFLIKIPLKTVIWLAIKTVVMSYLRALKRAHDYDDFSASWSTDIEWRVIGTWSAVGYWQCLQSSILRL
jgi:hypothetical protein